MADLGLLNFIRNELNQGQTKEQIIETLLKSGHTQATIDEAFTSLESGTAGTMNISSPIASPQRPESVTRQLAWGEFRGIFWKNMLPLMLIGFIGKLHIPFIIFFLFPIGILFGIAIMRGVWALTLFMIGKGSVLLTAVCFFSPPLAYYFVYHMTKKRGWDIHLNIFEQIFVILVGAFFLLQVMLITFAISAIFYIIFLVPHVSAPIPQSSIGAPAPTTIASQQNIASPSRQISTATTKSAIGTIQTRVTKPVEGIYILTENKELLGVFTASTTQIQDARGKSITFSDLHTGDIVVAVGVINPDGTMTPTFIYHD